jgi:ankyrin repeat protein
MKRAIFSAFVMFLISASVPPVCHADLNDDLFQAIKNNDLETVTRLLSQGADPNAKAQSIIGVDNITPLPFALSNRAPEIAKLLIEKGANVNFRDSLMGTTALIDATMFGQAEIAKLLLDKNADVTVKDAVGYTALIYAAIGGQLELIKLLTENGANINEAAGDGSGSTALHLCSCSAETVDLLITKGADIHVKDTKGATPLMAKAAHCPAEIAKLLINKGADVNARDQNGATPLIYAAKSKTEVAELLIKAGADMNAKDSSGHTALYAAEANGNGEMAELLRQMGAQGGKLPEEIPSSLSTADIDFLLKECQLGQPDIDAIPQLESRIQKILLSRIALRDCKLLADFKASRNYHRGLKLKSAIPMPPAGWSPDYLTEEEFAGYQKILDEAPW